MENTIAYLIALAVAWRFRYQGEKRKELLSLRIMNYIFSIANILFLGYTYVQLWNIGSLFPTVEFYEKTFGTAFYVYQIIQGLILLVLLVPQVARNIHVSTIVACFLLYSILTSIYFPTYLPRVLLYNLFVSVTDYIPSSWMYYFNWRSMMIGTPFYLGFHYVIYKYSIRKQPPKGIELDDHLISH